MLQDQVEEGVKVVYVKLPNVAIELLHPLKSTSAVAKFLVKNPSGGIHHLCFAVRLQLLTKCTHLQGSFTHGISSQIQDLSHEGTPILILNDRCSSQIITSFWFTCAVLRSTRVDRLCFFAAIEFLNLESHKLRVRLMISPTFYFGNLSSLFPFAFYLGIPPSPLPFGQLYLGMHRFPFLSSQDKHDCLLWQFANCVDLKNHPPDQMVIKNHDFLVVFKPDCGRFAVHSYAVFTKTETLTRSVQRNEAKFDKKKLVGRLIR